MNTQQKKKHLFWSAISLTITWAITYIFILDTPDHLGVVIFHILFSFLAGFGIVYGTTFFLAFLARKFEKKDS